MRPSLSTGHHFKNHQQKTACHVIFLSYFCNLLFLIASKAIVKLEIKAE